MHPTDVDPDLRDYLDRLQRVGYRPRFMADGTPCSVSEQGSCPQRIFVISIPKAGTYLAGEVLTALGVCPTRLHVDEGWASDFRDFRKGTFMWKYQFEMPVDDALRLVHPGQFAVGHLPASDESRRSLAGFARIFMVRELRHAFVSWARFVIAESMDSGAAEAAQRYADGPDRVHWVLTRPSSEWLVPTCRQMVAWYAMPDVLPIRFEDLVGDNGPEPQADTVTRLVHFLGLPIPADEAVTVARGCVGSETLTFSGARSVLLTHWDDRLEDWFHSVGGADIDRMLGYGESARPGTGADPGSRRPGHEKQRT